MRNPAEQRDERRLARSDLRDLRHDLRALSGQQDRPGIVREALDVRTAPLTFSLLGVLLVTTIVQNAVDPHTAHDWLMGSSTDVTNLRQRPLYVLLTSAVWLPYGLWLPYAAVFVLVLAPVERHLGGGRALLAWLSGHVGATLLTELSVAIAVAVGWMPETANRRLDVGVSYVVFASVGVLMGMLDRRGRVIVGLVAAASLAGSAATDFDLTTVGHLLSVAIGLAWWPVLRRRGLLGALSIRQAVRGRVPRPYRSPQRIRVSR